MEFFLRKLIFLYLILITTACSKQLGLQLLQEDISIGNHILETQDNNLLIAGRDKKNKYQSRGWITEGNGVLIKLNHKGTIIWKKKYSFLKNSVVYDIIETSNKDVLLVNPKREHYYGGRNTKNIPPSTYFTRLNSSGDIIHQKVLNIYNAIKIVSYTNNESVLLTVNENNFTIVHLDFNGNITSETTVDDNIDWIDEAYIKNDSLFINTIAINSDSSNPENSILERKIYSYNLNNQTHTHKRYTVSKNDIFVTRRSLCSVY